MSPHDSIGLTYMDISFTDYTAAAQTSLVNAAQEAAALKAAELQPEHVLLGLLSPASGVVWSWLTAIAGDPGKLRQALTSALADAPAGGGLDAPPLSYRTRRVLTEANDEATRARSLQIDTPHLLLGLLDEGGTAAQLLRQRGLDARTLRFWMKQHPQAIVQPHAPPVVKAAPRHPELRDDVPLRRALPRLINWYAVAAQLGILIVGGWLSARPDTQAVGIVLFVIGGWIFSLSMHEFAHALVADLGGDHGVREKGYLSFNPLKYTQVFLSIVLPLLFVLMGGIGLPGGAVYIDHSRLRGPRWDSAVSAAGPIGSALATVLFAAPFLLGLVNLDMALAQAPGLWGSIAAVVLLNVAAIVLNLLPIPPLDGFGIIAPWLNPNLRATLYSFGMLGVMAVFLLLWSSPQINQLFWNSVYQILLTLNVHPILAMIGLNQLQIG